MMKRYSLGFVLSQDGQSVALVQKNRPPMLAGLFNGIGGHIEEGETPLQACVREVEEEANLMVVEENWTACGMITDGEFFEVHVFTAQADLSLAKTMTDEEIFVFPLSQALQLPLAPSALEILEKIAQPSIRSQPRM